MTWAGTDKYTRSGKPFPGAVRLANASGAFGGVMSEYAIAVILSLYRKLSGYHRNQTKHLWQDLGGECTLHNKIALIFGTAILAYVRAVKLKAFGTFNIE